jgi:5'-nucleotidase
VFVVMAHLGATSVDMATGSYAGPLVDLANALDGFHAIFGDHTDVVVNTTIHGTPVVENRSRGLTYARVRLTVMPSTGTVLERTVDIVDADAAAVTPDPAVTAMLEPYRAQLSALLDAPIGVASNVFIRGNNVERLGEVAIGDFIAGALRARYGTQLALINGGGIRAPLPSSYLPANTALRRTSAGYAAGPPYDLVKGDMLAVSPFGNVVVTRTVTGVQLYAMLENGVSVMPGAAGRFPQIAGFKFSYSVAAPAGARVVGVQLDDGTPIAKDGTTYSLATVDFLNTGGDGYTMLADGQGTTREPIVDVITDAVVAAGTISPTIDGRITALP